MIETGLEERLGRIAAFLREYSRGLFDWRIPFKEGMYLNEPVTAEAFQHFPDIVDGLVNTYERYPSFQNSNTDNTGIFLEAHREVWMASDKHNPKLRDMLLSTKPDTIMDVCAGDQKSDLDYVRSTRVNLGRDVKLVAIDRDREQLENLAGSGLPMDLVHAEIRKGGTVKRFPESADLPIVSDIPKYQGSTAVLAHNACGHAPDNVAHFAANIGADYFLVERCCYEKAAGRKFLTKVKPRIPFNRKVAEIVPITSVESSVVIPTVENKAQLLREVQKPAKTNYLANMILADLYRQAVSLDLAIDMTRRGYSTVVEKTGKVYTVYGVRNGVS